MPFIYCSFDMQGAFILDLPMILVSGDQTFAVGDYFFANYYLLAPFLKNWPLKQVFRGHFGPLKKFFWLKHCKVVEAESFNSLQSVVKKRNDTESMKES